jgi:branched-subunit amino acid transport protein
VTSSWTYWGVIIGCMLATMAIKAAGPVLLGGRDLPPWAAGVTSLMAPALLSALVVTAALANGRHLAIGADTAGVAAGGLVVWKTGSVVACVVVAAGLTALLRAL